MKFKAIISGEDNFDKPYMREVEVEGETSKKAYTNLRNQNGIIEIISFKEI